jgi:hypothetical protein
MVVKYALVTAQNAAAAAERGGKPDNGVGRYRASEGGLVYLHSRLGADLIAIKPFIR